MSTRCIFCKQDSSNSRSIEHIIPESLGNTDHILPSGVVCDDCNNYIAREVEKPILDSQYFKERRFYAGLPNKKQRVPLIDGIHLQSLTHIQLMKSLGESGISVMAASEKDESRLIHSVRTQSGTLIFPMGTRPDDYIVSRFIAKIGLEVLTFKILGVPGGVDEIIDKRELDELRNYVRLGKPNNAWPFSFRPIYPPDFRFNDGKENFEVLHEFDILITDQNEFFIIVAIFGDEYVLNLGGPEIEGYQQWLKTNDNRSPLYSGKNLK